MNKTIAHSYLFVPANRPERFDRACSSGADAVIVDLEDAVPPSEKDAARASLAGWLSAERNVYVRLNAADTPWHEADVALCRLPGVAGVILPKAEHVGPSLLAVCAERNLPLLPLIETALGFHNAATIAAGKHVQRLVFGTIDFQVDVGIDGEGDELLFFRSQLVLISRLAGLQPPVDGVCTEIDEPEQLNEDTMRAKRLGFSAKLCIHPRQVPLVNVCFAPTQEEVMWAERVVTAARKADGAAIALDGKMVDRPVIMKAERILQSARR